MNKNVTNGNAMNMQNCQPTAQRQSAESGLGPRSNFKGIVYKDAFHQSGAALMVSLMILLVLTLIGVTSMSGTILEEKMASGVRNQNLAFQAAEAALRDGEIWLVTNCVGPCPPPVGELGSFGNLAAQNDTWWNDNAREYGVAGIKEIRRVSSDPRYIMEKRGNPRRSGSLAVGTKYRVLTNNYFRLTARGTGGNTSAEAILQSHYMVIN